MKNKYILTLCAVFICFALISGVNAKAVNSNAQILTMKLNEPIKFVSENGLTFLSLDYDKKYFKASGTLKKGMTLTAIKKGNTQIKFKIKTPYGDNTIKTHVIIK